MQVQVQVQVQVQDLRMPAGNDRPVISQDDPLLPVARRTEDCNLHRVVLRFSSVLKCP